MKDGVSSLLKLADDLQSNGKYAETSKKIQQLLCPKGREDKRRLAKVLVQLASAVAYGKTPASVGFDCETD